jgi:hypothetical protein
MIAAGIPPAEYLAAGALVLAALIGALLTPVVTHGLNARRDRRGREVMDAAKRGALSEQRRDARQQAKTTYDEQIGELDVEPGDLPNALHGRAVAERAVGAPLVVVAHPVWQRGATRLA